MSSGTDIDHSSGAFVKNDTGKVKLSLVPPEALLEVGKVFTYGAAKYPRDNFRIGTIWSRYADALARHFNAWLLREDADTETGINHLAHIAANAMILLVMQIGNLGTDDRPTYGTKQESDRG